MRASLSARPDVPLDRAPSIDASGASLHAPTVISGRSPQLSSLDVSVGQQHLRDRTERQEQRPCSAEAPNCGDQPGGVRADSRSRAANSVFAKDGPVGSIRLHARPLAVLSLDAKNNQLVNVVAGPTFRSGRDMWRRDSERIGILANASLESTSNGSTHGWSAMRPEFRNGTPPSAMRCREEYRRRHAFRRCTAEYRPIARASRRSADAPRPATYRCRTS